MAPDQGDAIREYSPIDSARDMPAIEIRKVRSRGARDTALMLILVQSGFVQSIEG
jgi:hypothetical protein